MDPIAHNRRLGKKLGDVIPDADLVDSAKSKDTDSARLILQLCYQRLNTAAATKIEKQLVGFLCALGFADSKIADLDDQTLAFSVADANSCVVQKREALGDTFADYLLECFASLSNGEYPAVSTAFRLRLAKGEGRSTEFERDMEIAQSVKLILAGLKSGKLLKHASSFLAGESKRLPIYVETLFRLRGIPSLAGYNPAVRLQLADGIRDQYKPLIRKQLADAITEITRTGGKSSITAAAIYVQCTKASAQLVKLAIDDPRMSDADCADLNQLLNTLNSYGATKRGSGKRGVSVRGIQNIYKQNKSELPNGSMRLTSHSSKDESRRLLAKEDLKRRRKRKAALDDPIIRQALDIIRSPNVGNHNRAELLKLQKQAPDELQHIWPELWEEFSKNALAHASRNYDRSQSSDHHGH